MLIRLTRKLADCIDGVDLSHYSVGDVLDLPAWEAHLLIAEAWASPSVGTADETRPRTPTEEELRCIHEQLTNWSEKQERRRAEDRIRDELRDSRAVIVGAGRNPAAGTRKRKS
jgi:hypothetical protein